MSLGAAVLELAERLAAGDISDEEYLEACGMVADGAGQGAQEGSQEAPAEPAGEAAPGERHLTGKSLPPQTRGHGTGERDMAMDEEDGFGEADGEGKPAKAAPAAPPVETHGSKAMRNLHKSLHGCRKALAAEMDPLDEGEVKSHLREHHAGMEKALKAISKFHAKACKGHDPIPDDYEDEVLAEKALPESDGDDPPADPLGEDAMGDLPPVEGIRPADETAGMGEDDLVPDDEDDLSDEDADLLKKSLPALERRLGLRPSA